MTLYDIANFEVKNLAFPVAKTVFKYFYKTMSDSEKEKVKMRTRNSVNDSVSPNIAKSQPKSTNKQSTSKDKSHSQTKAPMVNKPGPTATSDDKIDYLCKRIDTIAEIVEEIKELKRLNKEKDVKITELEARVEAMEQYSRVDNIVISGFKPNYSSYSRAVAYDQDSENHEHAVEQEQSSLEDQIVGFLQDNDIPIDKSQISACHTLPASTAGSPKPVVIRFVSRKSKTAVLKNSKNLRDLDIVPKVYINEHLTHKNAEIAKKARQLRRQKKIENTWTRNCKVFVKVKIGGNSKVMAIKSIDELDSFTE